MVGPQTHELKGVNGPELKTQVDLLIYEAFPRQLTSLVDLFLWVADDGSDSACTHVAVIAGC